MINDSAVYIEMTCFFEVAVSLSLSIQPESLLKSHRQSLSLLTSPHNGGLPQKPPDSWNENTSNHGLQFWNQSWMTITAKWIASTRNELLMAYIQETAYLFWWSHSDVQMVKSVHLPTWIMHLSIRSSVNFYQL